MHRRTFLLGTLMLATPAPIERVFAQLQWRAPLDTDAELLAIEQRVGGRLGVAVLSAVSDRSLLYRADERFPLCSTFKALLAAHVLARVDAGMESLTRLIPYTAADLLEYAPITQQHVVEGAMTVEALCDAIVRYSDNSAANLLLTSVGGPAGFTTWLRSIGDPTTRLDRNEPTLNTAIKGDPRDTTTPAAMATTLTRVLTTDRVLSAASRARLIDWLDRNTTGDTKLRAGFPSPWRIGDKTGMGMNGATTDVAIVRPDASATLLVAAYLAECEATADERNAALADVARVITRWWQD